MKIAFLGDSITQGGCASSEENTYVSKVGEMLGCTVLNYGVSGTRIAPHSNPEDKYGEYFLMRAKKMDRSADFVFVFGGTNDYGHGDAEMGEEFSTDGNTFNGAFNQLIAYLFDVYGKEKVCFILPLPRFNSDSVYGEGFKTTALYPLSDYVEAERKRLDFYGAQYMDLSSVFGMPKSGEPSEFFQDGLHPNDKGHLLLAKEIVKWLQSSK